ncbi:hypothetical protein [Aquimarina algiphila]|uniref:hypothetical protein n=1 Tax=Aquimarina algiphila TaxID=2047982 RepID=UPI0024935ACD|nr:hypothetical protein [Aquimarina algiphila]
MRNNIKLLNIGGVIFSIFLMMNCNSSDDDSTPPPESEINLEEAKLSGFPLFGIEPVSIDIVDPEIVDNKEVNPGEIKITLASSILSLEGISVSITSEELNLSKFSISPGNDVRLSFEDQKVHVFTIYNAIGDKEELLHYNVSIVKEDPVIPATLKITGFVFEKSKNPDLSNDITVSRTIEESGRDILYVFVPLGTDFTNLVPTITYDGPNLYYTQDSSILPEDITTEFPTTDTSIDFEYPKSFILLVRNDNDFKTTQVIVDVINPVRIETTPITVPDVAEGSIPPETFRGVTKWINQGNHPIVFQRSTTYENDEPMIDPRVGRVILARRVLPPIALNPGENADIDVTIDSRVYTEGTYKSTAVFYSRIRNHQSVDDLLEPAKLSITAKIIK